MEEGLEHHRPARIRKQKNQQRAAVSPAAFEKPRAREGTYGGGGGAGGKPAPARGLRGAPADLKLKAGRAAALIERAVEELNMLPEDFSAARASLKNSAEALRAAAAALAGGAREGARGGLAALGQAHCLTELAMEREELAGAIEVSTRKACPGIMKDRANLYLQMAAQCTSLKAMPLFLPPVAGTGP